MHLRIISALIASSALLLLTTWVSSALGPAQAARPAALAAPAARGGPPTYTPIPTDTPTPTPGVPTATPTACFITCLDPSDPFYAYWRCLICLGVFNDGPFGACRSAADITRGQIAKVVVIAAHIPLAIPSTQQTFEDVPNTSPFWVYIEALAGRSIVGGYACGGAGEPCAPPNNRPYYRWTYNATRGQMAKFIALAANFQDPVPTTQQTFADVPPTSPYWLWAERLALHAVLSGYTCGGPGEPCDPQARPYFRPTNNVTRGQSTKILANAFYPNCNPPAR